MVNGGEVDIGEITDQCNGKLGCMLHLLLEEARLIGNLSVHIERGMEEYLTSRRNLWRWCFSWPN